jgi:plasmid stabilization system protein ParE
MNYRVVWGPRAEDLLAAVWLAAADRNRVSQAVATLDRLLARAPLELGESRASSVQRVAFEPPIGIEFEVVEDDKRVIVQGVFAAP